MPTCPGTSRALAGGGTLARCYQDEAQGQRGGSTAQKLVHLLPTRGRSAFHRSAGQGAQLIQRIQQRSTALQPKSGGVSLARPERSSGAFLGSWMPAATRQYGTPTVAVARISLINGGWNASTCTRSPHCVAMVPSRPRLANAHGGQPRSTAAAARAFGRLRNCIMLPSLCSNTRGPTVSSFRALSWCGQRHCSPVCPGAGALIGCVYIWTASPRHVAPASTSIHHRLFDENLRPSGQSARSVLAEHVACVPGAYMPCIFVLSRETGHEARPVLCTGWLVLHCQCLSRFVRGQSNHASDEPPIAVAVARELFS